MTEETKRLILQYKEYLKVSNEIELLKNKLLKYKILKNVLEVGSLSKQIELLENLQNRISDEMSFKNHIVWIEYKYYAYKKSSKDISTLSDLIQHCLPVDYICTKRFMYLKQFIDINKYANNMNLVEFIKDENVSMLINDVGFMQGWQNYEYYINKGKIAKWMNYRNKLL